MVFKHQKDHASLGDDRVERPKIGLTQTTQPPTYPVQFTEAHRRFACTACIHDGLVIYINAVHAPTL
jgi:hypothetical protein